MSKKIIMECESIGREEFVVRFKDTFEAYTKKYNYFELSSNVDNTNICGYELSFKHNTSFELLDDNLTWACPRLCLELNPIQDFDVFDYLYSLYGKINVERERKGKPYLNITQPKCIIDGDNIIFKWHDITIASIKCKRIDMIRNVKPCDLDTLNSRTIFTDENTSELFTDNEALYYIISPYNLGLLNEEQKSDLKFLYLALNEFNDIHNCSTFIFYSVNMNNGKSAVGLWDNLKHTPYSQSNIDFALIST